MIGCLLVALIGALAHLNTMNGAFVFDDFGDIVDNERIDGLNHWSTILRRARRPLTELTFAANHAVGGFDPTSYHIVNIAIHLITGVLLFLLGRRLLEPIGRAQQRPVEVPALVIALVWVAHPLSTAAVTYTVQRAESLTSMFYVAGMLAWMIALRRTRAWPWLLLTIACSALGLASKAIVITLPVMLILLDFAHAREPLLVRIRRRGFAYLGVISTWIVLVHTRVAVGVLSTSHPVATAGFSYKDVSPWAYLLTQTEILLHNLRLIIWPTGLSIDYNWLPAAGLSDVLLPAAIVLLLCALVVIVYIRAPHIGVIPAMFFVVLAPTSTIIPIKDLANDHRIYLASFGVIATIVLIAWMCLPMLARLFPRRGVQVVAGAIAVTIIGTLVYATNQRAALYANELNLWRDVLVRNPDNPRALFRIGKEHEEEGRFDEAEASFRRAIAGWPDYTEAHLELAGRLRADRNFAEAIIHYRTALDYRRNGRPKMTAIALFGLTQALLVEGQFNAASQTIEEALTYDDSRADIWLLAGALRFRSDELDDAAVAYETAARLDPLNAIIHHDLGMLYKRMDKVKDAERSLRRTIELDPAYTDAYYQLGIVRQRRQDLKEAAELYQKTLDLEPDHERARQRLQSLQGSSN